LDELQSLNIATDGAIASSPDAVCYFSSLDAYACTQHSLTYGRLQRESFWSWRTKLPPAIVQTGPHSIHFDISMPIAKLYQVVLDTRAWMTKEGIIGRDVKAV
jgi:hypothetical protein